MRNLLFKLLGFGVLAVSFSLGWLWMNFQYYANEPLQNPEVEAFVIRHGSSLASVAGDLERAGVVDSAFWFRWMARLHGHSARIQAGDYLIEPGLTAEQLLEKFTSGKVHQYPLTVVEGWSFREMMDAVSADPYLEHTLDGLDFTAIMAHLGLEGEHPEGRFMPDTYHFPHGLSDVEFLRRAHQAMDDYLAKAWSQKAEGLPYKSAYEALIMASIVEKETALPEERPAIAGVFVRRLQKGMRLQTDPTVIYGLGERFDGNLRRVDLKRDTPYNTYTRKGLPPTPIAMPGREAIDAALHPQSGDSLYFVSRGDGSHHFSSTLKEHNEAVIRYQLNGRRREFSSYNGNGQ